MSDMEVNIILAMIQARMINNSTRISITVGGTHDSSRGNDKRKWNLFTGLVMFSIMKFNGLRLAFDNVNNCRSQSHCPCWFVFQNLLGE